MANILHIFSIKSDPQKIFEAICSPEGLDNWWPLKSSGEPVEGNTYSFYFSPEHDWRAKVIHVNKNQSITWHMTQAMDDWLGTEVGFILEEKDENVQLTFFHNNWSEASEHFGIATFCWGQLLNGLKNYVEKGVVIPHDLRN